MVDAIKPIETISAPKVIAQSVHGVGPDRVGRNAARVLQTLLEAGFESYLVGGGVRDLLLGLKPKDFDIATAAEPEQVRELFKRCRLIGRRFRLAHVRFGPEVVEVATFRANDDGSDEQREVNASGRIVRDNVFGSLEDDAWRRDFSVNALYFDIRDGSILDFVGGYDDIGAKRLRLIGDAEQRYREDPVRILRAVRFAAKLGFTIAAGTESPIKSHTHLLDDVPPARLFDECLKLFMGGHGVAVFEWLNKYDLFSQMFPETGRYLANPHVRRFVTQALANTDERLAQDKPVTPGFLFAAFLWEPMRQLTQGYKTSGMSPFQAVETAGNDVVAMQSERIAFPRRFSLMAREIWSMQLRLEQRKGRKVGQLLARQRFRAAYDFLMLRDQAGEEGLSAAVKFWTDEQSNEGAQRAVTHSPPSGERKPGRLRRRRRRPASDQTAIV